MKIMLLLQKLNKLFLLLSLLVSASLMAAETNWEVAIVFRGEQVDTDFQKDVDANILELARLHPSAQLKIGIYREMNAESFIYLPAGSNNKEIALSDLLSRDSSESLKTIKIPGTLKKTGVAALGSFLKSFYKNSNAKKALVIYSHGKGADGLRGLSTKELKDTLTASAPHLDLLWFDACFMANLEFLYELRSLSEFTIASEEAEFTSGLPFQTLSELPHFSNTQTAAISIAKNFIDSYSYLKNGSQRNYVSISSATISVIENKKLDILATGLKEISLLYKKLTDEEKKKFNKTLLIKAAMDDKSMVDLGSFLIQLRVATKLGDAKITELIRLLNIESVRKLKTNPRIHIQNPAASTLLVYGFNNWQAGNKEDFSANTLFSSLLKNDSFIEGPNAHEWPLKKIVTEEIFISPFAPGINIFNFYFLNKDGKLLSKAQSILRTHDVAESSADTMQSPLIYTAYTQQLGTKAERYTGLNITIPGSVPSMDYFELEFNQFAQWLSL